MLSDFVLYGDEHRCVDQCDRADQRGCPGIGVVAETNVVLLSRRGKKLGENFRSQSSIRNALVSTAMGSPSGVENYRCGARRQFQS